MVRFGDATASWLKIIMLYHRPALQLLEHVLTPMNLVWYDEPYWLKPIRLNGYDIWASDQGLSRSI